MNLLVTAFSFALNTNLNTTRLQLVSAAHAALCVHAPVFKLCVQTIAEEKKIIRESLSLVRWIFRCLAFLLSSLIYWFRFIRAYIKPEPNQFAEYAAHALLQPLEHRTDGTDAFDTIYIGAEKFPFHDTFSLSVSRVP